MANNLLAIRSKPYDWSSWTGWLREMEAKVKQMEWKAERKRAREANNG